MRLCVLAVLACGCTSPAPWGAEGSEGEACFPDGACDPGLACIDGRCRRAQGPDLGLPDLALDLGVPADGRRPGERPPPKPDGARPDKPPSCPLPPPPPLLLPYPKSTVHAKVVLRGSAVGAKQVLVSGGKLSGVKTVSVAWNSSFCVEVELVLGATSNFLLLARDAKGCLSSATSAVVTQASPAPVNLLAGLLASTKDPPESGLVSYLTDGQTSQVVKFSFNDPEVTGGECDNNEHLWFDLGSTQPVDQVIVKYPVKGGFKYYLTCWTLLASNQIAPAPPDPKHPDWKIVKQATSGSAQPLTISIPGTPARHLALIMYEDNATGIWETFELTEVEAWGTPGAAPPDSCP
jgi:hypothetical protein